MDRVKVPGYGEDGNAYIELEDNLEIKDNPGNPTATGDDWERARWELWDGDKLIWCVDYSGIANPSKSDPKEASRRQLEWFAALYSLGKRKGTNLD